MSVAPERKRARPGAPAALIVACFALGGLGLALDLMLDPRRAFFLGALPGGRGVIGLAAAVAAVGAGWLMRLVLARPTHPQMSDDAGDHA